MNNKRLEELIETHRELNELAKLGPDFAFVIKETIEDVEIEISLILQTVTIH